MRQSRRTRKHDMPEGRPQQWRHRPARKSFHEPCRHLPTSLSADTFPLTTVNGTLSQQNDEQRLSHIHTAHTDGQIRKHAYPFLPPTREHPCSHQKDHGNDTIKPLISYYHATKSDTHTHIKEEQAHTPRHTSEDRHAKTTACKKSKDSQFRHAIHTPISRNRKQHSDYHITTHTPNTTNPTCGYNC